MTSKVSARCFLFYALVHLSHVSLACILLLNGWAPLSVYERSSLSDIVATGEVLRTFKDVRTDVGTYTAEVQLQTVHKGSDLVVDVQRASGQHGENVFNISNFGDKAMCYADVTAGEHYIFFLTVFQDRLSAKYDDIFGAVADYTPDSEQGVLDYLGWRSWSTWSSCSESCGNGHQSRRRTCSRENVTQCEGSEYDNRYCNTFSCTDVIDLVPLLGLPKLPLGVTRSGDRPRAFAITRSAKLFLPVTSVFHVTFPRDFAILMTLRRRAEQEGYALVINDISGRQRIAVYIGTQLRLEYLETPSKPVASLTFNVAVEPEQWYHIAIKVQGKQAVLYFDCNTVIQRKLKRGNNSLGTNLMLSVGPYFANYGPAFQGDIEQLGVSEDPLQAERQCHFQTGDHFGLIKDDNGINNGFNNAAGAGTTVITTIPQKETAKPTRPAVVNCQQPCQNGGTCNGTGICLCPAGYFGDFCESATCGPSCQSGRGCSHSEHSQCSGNASDNTHSCNPACLNGGQCIGNNKCACPYGYVGEDCQPFCRRDCHNGGVCVRYDQCRCPSGYTGRYCAQPVCRQGCANGGRCVSPNRCACPDNFRGNTCSKPRCRPQCKNGGTCVAPSVCACAAGYLGPRCKKYKCDKKCRRGGKCVGPNKCDCPSGSAGRWCHKEVSIETSPETCNTTCLNGGRCQKKSCRCPKNFFGRRCERRSCKYEQHTIPYKKTYKRIVKEEVMTRCGPWNWRTCVRTRLKYVTITTDAVRTAYRCV